MIPVERSTARSSFVSKRIDLSKPVLSDPITQYTTVRKLFDDINATIGDILKVQGVSSWDLAAIEKAREISRRKWRIRRYHSDSRILIVTIPTLVHEQLHLQIWKNVDRIIYDMGLDSSWSSVGGATYQTKGHPGGDGGEGDSSGGPRSQVEDPEGWPTLVIEAGDSESMTELHQDMYWWFAASKHQVKIVLLVKLDHPTGHIFLERWEEEQPPVRPGATTTRKSGQLSLRLQQTITIVRDTTKNPPTVNVTSGALVLKFELLFLRPAGLGERDVVIDVPSLIDFGERVWAVVRH